MAHASARTGVSYPMVFTQAGPYTRLVISVPVWICWPDYVCCGTSRRAGDTVELDLTFAGDVDAASEPDRINVQDDGQVVIVGAAAGPVLDEGSHTDGSLIVCGDLEFAIKGEAPARRVRCCGYLHETRHGWPSGRTTGELTGIRWLPEILRSTGNGEWLVEGYGAGEAHASTEEWRERARPDLDDPYRHGWSLLLTVEVSGVAARGSHDQPGAEE